MHERRRSASRGCVLLIIALAAAAAGCRTSRPPATPLTFEDLSPDEWRDRRITLTGRVDGLDYAISGEQGSFTFALVGSGPDETVLVSESGYNTLVMSEVVNLLTRAERRGVPVTVTGILRIGPFGEILAGSRLEIDTLSIEGNIIDTDHNDQRRYPVWGWQYYDDC